MCVGQTHWFADKLDSFSLWAVCFALWARPCALTLPPAHTYLHLLRARTFWAKCYATGCYHVVDPVNAPLTHKGDAQTGVHVCQAGTHKETVFRWARSQQTAQAAPPQLLVHLTHIMYATESGNQKVRTQTISFLHSLHTTYQRARPVCFQALHAPARCEVHAELLSYGDGARQRSCHHNQLQLCGWCLAGQQPPAHCCVVPLVVRCGVFLAL